MDQLRNYADDRLLGCCIYCRGEGETRDHVPSRVLLDRPYPENLPVVQACRRCNNGFSLDEEYFACLLEVVLAGSVDPAAIKRQAIADVLRKSPSLSARFAEAEIQDGSGRAYQIERDRVARVLLKLARGHVAYELSHVITEEPDVFWWQPLENLSDEDRENFDSPHFVGLLGEVGSRSAQRLMVVEILANNGSAHGILINDWVDVQSGSYRFRAVEDVEGINIRMVVRDYLACEVAWVS